LVVRAAVVVAGEPEASWRPEDQERGREGKPPGPPPGPWAEPCVAGVSEQLGRVERRQVVAERVVLALERRPGGVDDERAEPEEHHDRLEPPRIAPHGMAERTLNR